MVKDAQISWEGDVAQRNKNSFTRATANEDSPHGTADTTQDRNDSNDFNHYNDMKNYLER